MAYSLTGCAEIVCEAPLSTAGYASLLHGSLAAPSFDVSASCATGYSGTAVAAVCSTQGSAYTLTGCVVATCVPPSSTVGYTSIITGSLVKSSFDVSASCADGYEGTADAVECDDDGMAYSLTGCDEIVCEAPLSTCLLYTSPSPRDS